MRSAEDAFIKKENTKSTDMIEQEEGAGRGQRKRKPNSCFDGQDSEATTSMTTSSTSSTSSTTGTNSSSRSKSKKVGLSNSNTIFSRPKIP